MFDKAKETERYLIGNYEISAQLTTGRTLKITGVMYSDDSPDEVNKRLDAAQDVVDRQFIRSDLFVKEAQKSAQYEALRQISGQAELLVKKRDKLAESGKKLMTQERDRVDNFEANLATIRTTIESLDAAIAAGRKKLNGAHQSL